MNVSSVLEHSLTIHTTLIWFGLYDTVPESPSISADLESGTGKFPVGHLVLVNWPDDLHEYSPYYGPSGEAASTKFIRYCARNSRNMICCMSDQTPIVLSSRLHRERFGNIKPFYGYLIFGIH
jgi:hypothetical protein